MTVTSSRVRSLAAVGVAALTGASCLFGATFANAALPAQNETVMVSVDASAPPVPGDIDSGASSISADGRYVAFASSARNLVAEPNHSVAQVYVRDMLTDTTTLVSVASSGMASGNDASISPSISADGRFIAFASMATDLTLPNDAGNTAMQVYVRDLTSRSTRKVSLDRTLSMGGDGDSTAPSISADGSLVAFQSAAGNLLPGIAATDTQVYLAKNAADPKIFLASSVDGSIGMAPNDDSMQPDLSGDGKTVAFVSAASNVTSVGGNGKAQVYVRDLTAGTTRLLTFTAGDPTFAANDNSDSPSISFDGSRIAYGSRALDLVAKLGRPEAQVYLFDTMTGTNSLVSIDKTNTLPGDVFSSVPSISADGSLIAFSSFATNLTDVTSGGTTQVYLRDLSTSSTTMVSSTVDDGQKGGNGRSANARLAPGGGYVGFDSFAPDVSVIKTDGRVIQTYLRGIGAVGPTPTPTPTVEPTTTPTSTAGTGTGTPTTGTGTTGVAGGQGGAGGGGRLASTGMSQAPIIVAGVSAAVLALVGGSILLGARAARRRKLLAGAEAGAGTTGDAESGGSVGQP